MLKKIHLLFLLLGLFHMSFAQQDVVCPSENKVKNAFLAYAAALPRPVPMPFLDIDYVAVGFIKSDERTWYLIDGLFSHVNNEKEALQRGQALLKIANPPQGPYHKYFDAWGCVYHMSAIDAWDRRPKFIIAVTGGEPKLDSIDSMLSYVK